jgi:hypothetical protein
MLKIGEEGKGALNFILNKMVIKDSQLLKLINDSYHIQAPEYNFISQIYDGCNWFKQHFWEFNLENDEREYKFDCVAHAIHNPEELKSFLVKDNLTNKYSAHIKANPDNKRFPKSNLILFASIFEPKSIADRKLKRNRYMKDYLNENSKTLLFSQTFINI